MEDENQQRQYLPEDFGGDDDYELERPSRKIAKLIFIFGTLIVIAFLIHYIVVEMGAN